MEADQLTSGQGRQGDLGKIRGLSNYLEEMRANTRLSREDEVRLASRLQRAREAFVDQLRQLPAGSRRQVLSDSELLAPNWTLVKIEQIFARIQELAAEPENADLRPLLKRVRAHKGEIDRTRETMIVCNLRLVVHLARRLADKGLPLLDLVQEGNIGLMTAVDKFDWERGCKFSTYAVWWIRQSMTKAFVDKSRLIRVPSHVREAVRTIRRTGEDLSHTLGRTPSEPELAEATGFTLARVERMLRIAQDPQALEQLGPGASIDEELVDPLTTALDEEAHRSVRAAMEGLSARERRILELRFGFDGKRRRTLAQIGKIFELSRERVRQIERVALGKVRHALHIGRRP